MFRRYSLYFKEQRIRRQFAVYSASPKYYDYKKYASGDQAEFDFTNYHPEVLEAVTKDLDKTVYLGENVTLSAARLSWAATMCPALTPRSLAAQRTTAAH